MFHTEKKQESGKGSGPLRIIQLQHNHVDQWDKQTASQGRNRSHRKNRYAGIVRRANLIEFKIT